MASKRRSPGRLHCQFVSRARLQNEMVIKGATLQKNRAPSPSSRKLTPLAYYCATERGKHMLERIILSPYLNLLSGFILLITSGYETWHTIDHFSLGAHHGVLVFSIIQILKTLPDIVDGTKELTEARSVA